MMSFIDNQLQDKKDLIISTIVKGQETSYNAIFSQHLSLLFKNRVKYGIKDCSFMQES
jgi:hypothetical protein